MIFTLSKKLSKVYLCEGITFIHIYESSHKECANNKVQNVESKMDKKKTQIVLVKCGTKVQTGDLHYSLE